MTPIFDAMTRYIRDNPLAFHTPGHKRGLGAHDLLKEFLTDRGLSAEVSLMEELDDLNSPATCIRDAENLAAEIYGADDAFFSVNGTTGAIQSMMLATLKEFDEVIVARNAHRSIVGGLILTGARPIFINPRIEDGLQLGIDPAEVESIFKSNSKIRAVILVSPTYFGITSNLEKISRIAHDHGSVLLIDEAHGSHLKFSDRLPKHAIESGANFSATSTHKLLGSLTQTSMLLFKNSGGINFTRESIQHATNLIQTTSPNYILLASLDIARQQMFENGNRLWNRAIDLSNHLRDEISKIDGFETFNRGDLDPTKVSIDARRLGLTGIELESILRWDFKIQCELSDPFRALFLITYSDTEDQIERLLDALKLISRNRKVIDRVDFEIPRLSTIPEQILTPRQAFFSKSKSIPIQESIGKISAEEINFYPPGIPILYPGELISREIIDYIREMMQFNIRLVSTDPTFQTIKIIQKGDI